MNSTLYSHIVNTDENRRRADRVIWAGLARHPRRGDLPTIVIEFVSKGKRDRIRDFEEKRAEYMRIGIKAYWIIDRFNRSMTVITAQGKRSRKRVYTEAETFTTPLLPGFELPLAKLFTFADRWEDNETT